MPPKKDVIVTLKDEEAFNTYITAENKKLVSKRLTGGDRRSPDVVRAVRDDVSYL